MWGKGRLLRRSEQNKTGQLESGRKLGADGVIPFARMTGGQEEEGVANGKKMAEMAAQVMALKEGGGRAKLEQLACQIMARGFLPYRKWRISSINVDKSRYIQVFK